jgi:Reverse transcriptase (RNA-dependent DNA polymerase)
MSQMMYETKVMKLSTSSLWKKQKQQWLSRQFTNHHSKRLVSKKQPYWLQPLASLQNSNYFSNPNKHQMLQPGGMPYVLNSRAWKKRKFGSSSIKKVPPDRTIIRTRWVFARKYDGRFRARSVAKGFSQIPGKDFQQNHAPVVSETTMHLLLVIKTTF